MRLVILTQVADPQDPNLGVFFRWFVLLSKHFEKTSIVALSIGKTEDMPDISFFSAGRERGRRRIFRRVAFFFYSLRAVFQSDVIFIHMIPEYVLAVGWIARILGKRVYLWYAHGAVTWKLKLAHSIVDGVISSSPQGFRLPSKKATFVGQAIDTDLFRPGNVRGSHEELKIITVGRISGTKHLTDAIQALHKLKEKSVPFRFSIIGAPITEKDHVYQETLTRLIRERGLDSEVDLMGSMPPEKVAEVLRGHDLFLNLSETGSLDKAVLEAMSSGLAVLTSNHAYRTILPERYFLDRLSPEFLALRIETLRDEARPALHLREIVVRDHNLETTIEKIAARLKRQKFVYISPLRYPSDMAGSAFAMKSCEAFADRGVEVELWVPWRRNPKLAGHNPFAYHGVKKNFRIVRLPAADLPVGKPFFYILEGTFAFAVLLRSLFWRTPAIYYSHEEFALTLLSLISKRTVYEIHDFVKDNRLDRFLIGRVGKIISTNTWKKNKLIQTFGIPPEKVFVIPNAVDVNDFTNAPSQSGARLLCKLPENKTIAVYTGSLYDWKGVGTLIEASKLLSEIAVYIVGGTAAEIEKLKRTHREIPNVVFVGQRPHEEIPLWLSAADMLILPNTAKEDISKYYTSPVKLFEYMASGRPIIASDLPSIREVADEMTVQFFEPDNPKDLATKIEEIMKYPESALAKAHKAKEAVRRYTWEARAASILKFLKAS